jgi:UDP-2,4-diacetamido-2,4,6-trideoxy-beta-L-altropyranose hydrolase
VIPIPQSSLPLVIRADASMEIGIGHIMRCLALAESWQDTGGEVFFVSSYDSPALEDRLKKDGIEILHISQEPGTVGDAVETARIAHERGADWIVVDGYHFGAEYQKTITGTGLSLLFIDDYGHADHYYADIVLNQNIYADMSFYKNNEPYTRFLLGTKYVLLRREFLKYSDWHRDIPEVARKILVTLGGSDPDNVTLKVIKAVRTVELDGLEVVVVIGGANPHFDLIHETVKDLSNFTLIKNAEDMPELMAWADIAISGGGNTCLELMYMGLPTCVILMAKNQVQNVNSLDQKKIIINLGNSKSLNQEQVANNIFNLIQNRHRRQKMSEESKILITGNGSIEITRHLKKRDT